MNKESGFVLTDSTVIKYSHIVGEVHKNLTVTALKGIRKNILYITCRCNKCFHVMCNSYKYLVKGKFKGCNICNPNRRNFKHGFSGTGIYFSYIDMLKRCYNPSCSDYKRYGARGIRVCERWLESFNNFYDDMSATHAKGLTIDRIDNNKGYEPSNCQWITRTQQNNKKYKSFIYWEGCKYRILDLINSLNLTIKEATFRARLKAGWSLDKIINTPVKRLVD